ncbi:SHOCT domain-containing protein [Methylobacterium nonmethylotrophicum]|uniref:SHOCT domain-containing protein n=1 Tax=Methylobacterium nonmethylotrophicum TaxID=1141884 RepID=A0A4Z0NNX8_9HYPH|nr:SHOCT domain-containing protein [Methylobacterium nonmethylotrophicum]TGD98214.1 SHOCT domain-containing protein [Methylobacterium nonmethylotrophicum]
MSDLDAIAARHGVSPDAARHLLDALARGHGRMAQFDHPDLGGMGQWTAGGMTMIGDMFNSALKARVVALCDALAPLALAMPAGRQGFSGQGFSSGSWWPEGLGQPATAGSQNESRYAFFPDARRLAIETGGRVTLYDTGDHRIGGVSQQQGSGSTLSFTSQHGPVSLHTLPVVDGPAREAGHNPGVPQGGPEASAEAWASGASTSQTSTSEAWAPSGHQPVGAGAPAGGGTAPTGDVLSMIERLSELHRKGVLTEAEFAAKKTELLARL